jgi:stage II sporulation protein D
LVRVAILTRQNEIKIQAPENFTLTGFDLPVSSAHSVTLNAAKLSAQKARLQTLANTPVRVNGQSYQGAIEFFPDANGTLTVVNEVGLEDYVAGVLLGEVPRDWPLEAMKAQAIAARTFAVLKRTEARAAGSHWDLESHTLYQVYKGSTGASDTARQAVSKTRGEILTWKGQPIMAFYHSNCGGKTCLASNVWGQDQPYLKSVRCPFCRQGPHFSWKAVLTHEDITRKLRAAGLKIGNLADLRPLERDDSDRILEIEVIDTEGRHLKMRGNAFRSALGSDVIRGTRFNLELTGEGFEFRGRGWGHGVGMCQEGAWGMARDGYRCSEILRKYYPGALIEEWKGL